MRVESAAAPAPVSKSNVPVIAAAAAVAVLALGGAWYLLRGHAGDTDGKPAQSAAAPPGTAGQPAATPSASAAPVAVAAAAGLHVSRIDGSPLVYNDAERSLPDLLICRPEYADEVIDVVRTVNGLLKS